ncbi:Putative thiol:disulfide interchange protein dsbD precursor [Ehrlichia ruminantium str. Gardel]|uniref:protein-disulfide reductase DsbD family protein n=1 Tax=Ehrlichia ruminantium TaxID=779 RepID=UPI00004C7952|nr:thioredoxin family protein [Ehrlichia ruminantium]CAI28315.1 Putative thiol:disulfide interchange protein dsbD precursor [Ehrlichia ruminantium str. Gardel]
MDLIYVLACSLIGGIILNCMPCVFPVLSLKIMSILKNAQHSKKSLIKADGIAYTCGVMVSMLILSVLLLVLRYFGYVVGWGYHMQSPVLITGLMYIMFLMGLSFSGFYYIPFIFPNITSGYTEKEGLVGSFIVGMISTLIATPCTAPFMVSAIVFALNQPWLYSLLIFQALGFGVALPYLVLSCFPQLLSILPKPGEWMKVLQQFLAFPLYFSAAWLFCILIKQTGIELLFPVLSSVILFVMGIWVMKLINNKKLIGRIVICFVIIIFATSPLYFHKVKESIIRSKTANMEVLEFSETTLTQLLDQKKNVLLSVGADWCLTCRVNERIFQLDTIQALFVKKGVIYMKGDLTSENSEMSSYVNKLNKEGIPLYVLYVNGEKVKTLPQMLTEKVVVDTINKYVK